MLNPDLIKPTQQTYLLNTSSLSGQPVIRSGRVKSINSESLDEAENIELDKKITKFVGFSMSTYQNKSNPAFAQNSNWGQLEKKLFTKAKGNEHLASGGGVDILDETGRALILKSIKGAHGNIIRFSVEWADVEPEPGKYNETAIQRYIESALFMKKNGITPVITLHHFVEPSWFSELGAFEYAKNTLHFVRFCFYVYSKMSDVVEHFVTFNEPAVYATEGYILGDFPPNQTRNFRTHTAVMENMFQAHIDTYDAIHSQAKEDGKKVKVGLTHQALHFIPSSGLNFIARAVCSVMNYRFHELFMGMVQKNPDKFDFFGVQYYSRPLIGGFIPDSICEKGGKMVKSMRFRFDPSGIKDVLHDVARYLPKKTLWVTETGTAGNSDFADINQGRGEYYAQSLRAVSEAQREGINVKAYLAWTLYGNFEWAHGFSHNHDFGVIHRRKFSDVTRLTPGYQVIQKIFAKL